MENLKSLKDKMDVAKQYAVKASDPAIIRAKEGAPPASDLHDELMEVLEKQQHEIDELKKQIPNNG